MISSNPSATPRNLSTDNSLKRIASEARQELERLLQVRVFLEIWVKVRAGWASNEEHLRSYGYE